MDLRTLLLAGAGVLVAAAMAARAFSAPLRLAGRAAVNTRSEERRVGKECM